MAQRPGARDEFGLSKEDREAGLFTLGDADDIESSLMAMQAGLYEEPSGPPDDDLTKRFDDLMRSKDKSTHTSIEERVAILETKVKKLEGAKQAKSKKAKTARKRKARKKKAAKKTYDNYADDNYRYEKKKAKSKKAKKSKKSKTSQPHIVFI